jgi:hypothetical protein
LSLIKSGLQTTVSKNKANEESNEYDIPIAPGKTTGTKFSASKSMLKKKTSIQPSIIPTIRLQTFKDQCTIFTNK